MKVEHPHPAGQPQRTTAGQPFKKLLAEAKHAPPKPPTPKAVAPLATVKPQATLVNAQPALKPRPPGLRANVAAVTQAAQLQTANAKVAGAQRQVARNQVDAEADRLTSVRSSHHQAAAQQEVRSVDSTASTTQKVDDRVLALIVKELESAFDGEPPHVERAANSDGKSQPFRADAAPQVKPAEAPARAEQAAALIERIETFVRSSRPALALTLNNSLGARVEIERLGPGQVALKLIGQKGPPSADAVARIRDELRARGLKVGALSVA